MCSFYKWFILHITHVVTYMSRWVWYVYIARKCMHTKENSLGTHRYAHDKAWVYLKLKYLVTFGYIPTLSSLQGNNLYSWTCNIWGKASEEEKLRCLYECMAFTCFITLFSNLPLYAWECSHIGEFNAPKGLVMPHVIHEVCLELQ